MKRLCILAAVVIALAGVATANDQTPGKARRPLNAVMVEELESWETRLEKEKDRALAPLPRLYTTAMASGEHHG